MKLLAIVLLILSTIFATYLNITDPSQPLRQHTCTEQTAPPPTL